MKTFKLTKMQRIMLLVLVFFSVASYFYIGYYGPNMITFTGKGKVEVAYKGVESREINGQPRREHVISLDIITAHAKAGTSTYINNVILTNPSGSTDEIRYLYIKRTWFSGGDGMYIPYYKLENPRNELRISDVFFNEEGTYKLNFLESGSLYELNDISFVVTK
jgi:hypothetical protein